MSSSLLHRWFPFLSWPRPTSALLQGEFWAGMTVGLMLVPQGVAYAALAGMPLVTGIYASLVPALVAVLWSSSTRLGVGPTALTSLLIGASITGLAEPGSRAQPSRVRFCRVGFSPPSLNQDLGGLKPTLHALTNT